MFIWPIIVSLVLIILLVKHIWQQGVLYQKALSPESNGKIDKKRYFTKSKLEAQ